MKNRIKFIFGYVLAMLCISGYGQTTTENYVVNKTYKVESNTPLNSDDPHKVSASFQYIDGLGRPKQSVIVKGGAGNYGNNELVYDWNAGSPTSSGFYNLAGTSPENQIVNGTTPFGDTDLLWKCTNIDDSSGGTIGPDGGWYTDHIDIDHTKAYRYTIWVKKSGNLADGTTYHGTGWNEAENLGGGVNSNPYFWYGDLPQIDTWYLMVGYIHPSDHTSGDIGISGVYDTDGNKIFDGTEYKWSSGQLKGRFRNFLYYANNLNTKQYFWSPIVQQINGEEDSLDDIINSTSVYNNEEFFAKDIVTHIEYDGFGRQAKEYLPYASGNTDGRFESNAKNDTHHYYTNRYADDFSGVTNPLDANVFSQKIFDNSSLSRTIEQTAPGNDWDQGNGTVTGKGYSDGHTIRMEYDTNSANEVKIFTVSTSLVNDTYTPSLQGGSSYYSLGELTKSITKDENWTSVDGKNHTTEEFTNKSGRVILKRTYTDVDLNLDGDTNDAGESQVAHDTYYVYDDFGNLTYVFPPEMNASSASLATINNKLSDLGYQYVYDVRNRLVEKQIPAKGREYIVYDKLDRPVLTQDAVQRGTYKWLFTKYDVLGRVAYTGIYSQYGSRSDLQGILDGTSSQHVTRLSGSPDTNWWTNNGTSLFYNNDAYSTAYSSTELHTVNYYDTYTDLPSGFTAPTSVYGQTVTTNTQGLATVSKTRVLGTNSWITTVTYYDEKARPIYVYAKNDYLNTTDIVESKLDFTGNVLETTTTHQRTGQDPIVTIDTFEYDHMDRLISQSQKVNDQLSERIVKNNYDDLGQLESKQVGSGTAKGYTGVLGVSIDDDVIKKISSNAWNNAGLTTIGSFLEDGYVEFQIDNTTGVHYMVGLASNNSNVHFSNIDYAIYVRGTSGIAIYEAGTNLGVQTDYQFGDVFRVERKDSKIYYKKNGVVFYISDKFSSGSLIGDVSMWTYYSQIKNLHIVDNSKGLQNVDYTYNVRGWLKKINEDNQNDNDLFNFTLHYNDPVGNNTTPLFNGNISQTNWNTASVNNTNNPVSNLYSYSYDALNRITSAIDNTGNYNLTGVSYDKNGNILTLQRTGHIDASATQFDMMDNLTYSYDGNQLLNVTDTSNKDFGFKDVTAPVDDYDYDANGNLIRDANKGISPISYNHLNLPTTVSFSSQQAAISYVYDASGTKLKKTVAGSGLSSINTEYAGNYIYENGVLQFFNQPEGYVKFENGSFEYVYQYKDHLGNVRLSYSDANNNGVIEIAANTGGNYTEIVEESNYYPFGLKHNGYNNTISANGNSTAQKFKYNGKELEESLGYSMYEYEARHYDAALARFVTIDPLAEDYSFQNPYAYAINDPVRYIDKFGMGPQDDIYLDRNGKEIHRVENDQPDRTFIVKTTKTTKQLYKGGTRDGNSNTITKKEAKATEKLIKSGNVEGDHMKNTVQIVNADTQQQMLDHVNQDDGKGGIISEANLSSMNANNFKEFSGNIDKNGNVVDKSVGSVRIPMAGTTEIEAGGSFDFHSHPSGQYTDKDGLTRSFTQPTSSRDISGAKGTEYSLGMRSKKVYVYDKTGVIAIIPFKNFGTKKK